MAFWGVEVKPGNPFTHEFDHSKGRLHISMATLGFGKATKKSMLQCNVGDRSPVYLCSLNPGSAESLQLNLELEEVDDVVFTVIGPRSIHLCGYYLRRAISRVPHPSDDNHSESYGEDIADTESERSDRSNDDEDEHEDSFIDDDGDPEVFSDEEEASRDNGPKGKKSSLRRLRKYQAIESDDDDEVFEGKIVNDSMDGGTEGTDKEDSLLISSMYKNHKASQTVLDQEMDAIGDRGAVDARKENGEDDGDRIIHKDLRNCNDFADCQTHGEATLEDNFVNPCTVLDVGDTIKLKKKKKGKEKVQEKETKISFTGHSNKLENNEQDETKMDKTQDHCRETETMDRTLPSSVIRDGKLGKREREEQSKEGVCLTANGAYGSNLFNLPEINEHNRKTTVDEDAEISDKAALPSAEKDSEKSRAKRRKKRQVNKGLDVEGGNGYHGDIVEKYKANINTAESGNPKLTNEKSFKPWAEVQGHRMRVLVDCGASDNFVAPKIEEELALIVDTTPRFRVKVVDRHNSEGQGRCRGVTLAFNELSISEDFFLFTIDEAEFVLGLAWLDKLGVIRANFKDSWLEILKDDEMLSLRGDPELCYGGLSLNSASVAIVPQLIQSVLDANGSVFQALSGLPPHRTHDHAIPLKEGAAVPNIRPYRYPHHQKSVIEQLVSDMLASGVIRPSMSPYASPVLLVKKKDDSWRFCVDCRALKHITIPDKFPIPVIDELLEELAGATVFSKLDWKSGYHRFVEDLV